MKQKFIMFVLILVAYNQSFAMARKMFGTTLSPQEEKELIERQGRLYKVPQRVIDETLAKARQARIPPACKVGDTILNAKSDPESMFAFISQTLTGYMLMSVYTILPISERPKIQFLSEAALEKHMGPTGHRRNYGAFYDYSNRTLYLNNTSEMGLLAVAFLHEMKHALCPNCNEQIFSLEETFRKLDSLKTELKKRDPDYWDEDREWISKNNLYHKNFNLMIFGAERQAFDSQANFLQELARLSSCVPAYFKAHELAGRIVARRPSNLQIAAQYELEFEVLQKAGIPLDYDELKRMNDFFPTYRAQYERESADNTIK